jgi:serine/threonine-protein kinase
MKCPKCKIDNPEDSKFCRKCATPLTKIPATLTSPPPEKEEATEKSALEFTPGQHFGKRYQIIEEIGRGGMGRVYKALDKELNRTVALKMIKPELRSHPGIVERFKKEIKLASHIGHKNVCRIHDLGEAEGIKFISMQYIEGQDLKDFIKQAGTLTIEKAVDITQQVCAALQAAHDEGVIHRDLKPQNIMIDKKGNAYVMDFGIARSLEAEEVTKPGAIIGTPHYMSPDQAEGKKADARSDIYSLGCIMYEMLTRKPPFEADTSVALIHKHLKEKPRAPSKLNPQISLALDKIILKCLEKAPEKRYQKGDEIIQAINEAKPDMISAAKQAKIRWKLYVPIAAIILIGLAIGFYFLMRKEKQPVPTPPAKTEWKNSIAVLPFADLSPQKDQEYFCDGVTEAIIGKISKLRELKVISRTSVMLYKDTKKNIKEIGQELDVGAILEGSIQKEEENIRISAQLINVEDGFHLWAETYDRKLASVFAIQDEISLQIVNALKIELGDEEKTILAKHYTKDIEAHNLYLKGRFHWNKMTEESLKKSIECFNQVIEKDPNFALAYFGLADSYMLAVQIEVLPTKEVFPKAEREVLKALEIDDKLAEAHATLAYIKLTYYWDWMSAEKEFKRAIKLNPNSSTAHLWYAQFLNIMKRHDESIAEIKKAQELDPISTFIAANVGFRYYYARLYDQAIEEVRKALELDPNYWVAHWVLGYVYAKKEMYNEAITELKKAVELQEGGVVETLPDLGWAYGISGKRAEALKILDQLEIASKQRYIPSLYFAIVYSGLGEKDQALEWLEKAYQEHDFRLVWIGCDPSFDSLRSDARFKGLLKKMNLE